ncbi:DUF1853 family protein [Aureibaculum conchae]|uniref:DUF1853 family protein n=1 Tax=Aureibaculum sp. 2308TA14-22 TaxID=3108392 RepID=UPI0033963FF0
MNPKSKEIQSQYQGYKNTPLLWENNSVLGLRQFELIQQNDIAFNEQLPENLRLGKRVERFVSSELKQHSTIKILLENTQVQHDKRTIGELDCILKCDGVPIHLEIIYKFYLFDERVGTTEIEHWIGPNRNDTLLKKLTKLKEKQLPLLYSEYSKPLLDDLGLNVEYITQKVCFKAQLFIPYKAEVPQFKLLNSDCINGFYIHYSKIGQFENCKFYIPSKVNWLLEIQTQVNWLNFEVFSKKMTPIINSKTSPLCWVKFPNGNMQKFFVVWWH